MLTRRLQGAVLTSGGLKGPRRAELPLSYFLGDGEEFFGVPAHGLYEVVVRCGDQDPSEGGVVARHFVFGHAREVMPAYGIALAGGITYLYFGAFDKPAVGASGAIFGLLGGVLGYSVRRGTFSWQNPLIRQLLILTALNLYIGFSVPNISNTAHIGGLVGGAAFGWLTAPTTHSSKSLRAATPTVILFGAELILLALWLLL